MILLFSICTCTFIYIISSAELKAHGELLWLFDVGPVSSIIALKEISS